VYNTYIHSKQRVYFLTLQGPTMQVITQQQHTQKQIANAKSNLTFMLARRNTSKNKTATRSSVLAIIEHLRYLQSIC
jgi:hypothetical protein